MKQKKVKAGCTIVIFGATGNLTSLKLLPAIYELYTKKGEECTFKIIGFARRNWTDDTLRCVARKSLSHIIAPLPNDFENNIHYIASAFNEDKGYVELKKKLEKKETHLYYFSVDPTNYSTILSQMHKHGFAHQDKDKRIILEKPFGTSYKTAKILDAQLKRVFKEKELYNIDHYLGKAMVQNLYHWREKNSFLEEIWNKNLISHIEIILDESLDVSKRPAFYDKVGALSDMVQNHALQVLSMITADVRVARKKSLAFAKTRFIKSLKVKSYVKDLLRAQYEGYRQHKLTGKEETLDPLTQTETFIAIRLVSSLRNWAKVPFYIKTGKALKDKLSVARIYFKEGKKSPCYLTFSLSSKNSFVDTSICRPSFLHHKAPSTFEDSEKLSLKKEDLSDYASLLWECLCCHKSNFVSLNEIMASWKLIDNIRARFQEIPLLTYAQKSGGPSQLKNFFPNLFCQDQEKQE